MAIFVAVVLARVVRALVKLGVKWILLSFARSYGAVGSRAATVGEGTVHSGACQFVSRHARVDTLIVLITASISRVLQ